MFKKILVANRGEIALRVIRACRELGIEAVAVYSDVDVDSLHVRAADEAYRLGPPPAALSYLNVDRILEIGREAKCDGVHPGYGFLAENAGFASRCGAQGLVWIGPAPTTIETMGNKIAARRAAVESGMPIVVGTSEAVADARAASALAKTIGYPIAIKAAAGGGGKGLKIARDPSEVDRAFGLATKEARAYFNDGSVYLERYLARPKHIEVQILGDKFGTVVHFGERDCSLQRRHQKLVEETPACIDETVRRKLCESAVELARRIRYDSAGTIECLVEGDAFFFLEMNTRIQVEHTITEMTWGVDLVKAQIRIAAGEALWFSQPQLSSRGHSIECRINAESPALDFRPSPGRVTVFEAPAGPGVRVDSPGYPGFAIPQEYDSLIAKLVVLGENREEARQRMLRALDEFRIEGVDTTIPFFKPLLREREFVDGSYTTSSAEAFLQARVGLGSPSGTVGRASAAATSTQPSSLVIEVNGKRFDVRVHPTADGAAPAQPTAGRRRFAPPKRIAPQMAAVASPMHGIVAEVRVSAGDEIKDGQVVAVIEAMKMMNEIAAHRHGTVKSIDVRPGDTVETGAALLTFAD